MKKDPSALVEQIKQQLASSGIPLDTSPVVVVCRRGNDSQLAVQLLHEMDSNLNIRDIRGGLHAWARDVDSLFPVYWLDFHGSVSAGCMKLMAVSLAFG